MLKTRSALIGLLLVLCGQTGSFAQESSPPSSISFQAVSAGEAAKWRADLKQLAAEIVRTHKAPFNSVSEAAFTDAVAELDRRIPSMSRNEIIMEAARIVALVGDGHTNISPPRDPEIGFRSIPLQFYLFEDGLFVRAASQELADLVGRRVLKIGSTDTELAVARVCAVISADNPMTARFFAPMYLAMPEVLHAVGLTSDPARASFVVEDPAGPRTVVLDKLLPASLLPSHTDTTWKTRSGWVDMRDNALAPAPLWLRNPDQPFWFEHRPDQNLVYAQINSVTDSKDETFAAFSTRLMDFVDAHPSSRLIVDLRLNRGGNGSLRMPLITRIVRSKVNRPGHFFVVIGRATFSAAQFVVNDFERLTDAVFIGEPTGSKGNCYGDSRKIRLARSGITLRVSMYYWQDWAPWDARQWTPPDIAAELKSADYAANADPAFQAFLKYSPDHSLPDRLREAAGTGGATKISETFRVFRADPRFKYQHVLMQMVDLGFELARMGRWPEALEVLRLNAETYPRVADAHAALGEAYFFSGNRERARAAYEQALACDPRHFASIDRLNELGAPQTR